MVKQYNDFVDYVLPAILDAQAMLISYSSLRADLRRTHAEYMPPPFAESHELAPLEHDIDMADYFCAAVIDIIPPSFKLF